jgi:NADH-quinone oxidoreductase subunit H
VVGVQEIGFWAKAGQGIKGWTAAVTGSTWAAELLLTLIGIICILSIILTSALVLVYVERKVCAFMQMRYGPNRVGPYGILQTVADIIKLMNKEDIRPALVSPVLWALAPILLFVASMTSYAVIPFDAGTIFVDLNIGVFYFVAVSSLATLPLLMAGWASNNKYALVGGMRTVAQMISYEIPMVLALLGVVMIVGSMKMSDIVKAQEDLWFIVTQPVAFVIYVIAATAETNRAPFDLVEAESELVAGPFTEYSGMRWAYFFLAEYAAMVAASCIAATLFLGGWNGPFLPGWIWFFLKVSGMIFLFMWFRWTFPRLRVDHLMSFGWRILLPLSLANIVVTGIGLWLFFPQI